MTRMITGAVGVLILIPACFLSHTVVWPVLLSIFALIAVWELISCVQMKNEKTLCVLASVFSLLPIITWVLCVNFSVMDPFRCIFVFSAFFFLSMQISAILHGNKISTEKLYSFTALVLYVVIAFTAILLIRNFDHGHQEGSYLYLLLFFGAWISDTFAYFTGKAFGKRKLCPSISPKKTVAGSIGGVVANMIGFAGYALVLKNAFDVSANVLFFAVLGALFSAIGQFGDLFASGIKRHYGIKDYGKLFPGHGGVLDRFDSTIAISLVMLMVYAAFGLSFLIG